MEWVAAAYPGEPPISRPGLPTPPPPPPPPQSQGLNPALGGTIYQGSEKSRSIARGKYIFLLRKVTVESYIVVPGKRNLRAACPKDKLELKFF